MGPRGHRMTPHRGMRVKHRAPPSNPGGAVCPGREVNDIVLVSKLSALVIRPDATNDDAGQGLAEYALILALIAIVSIVALLYLGGQISERLSQVGNAL